MEVAPTGKSKSAMKSIHSLLTLFIILITVSCLAFSLATRTFRLSLHQRPTIKSNVSLAVRQHMDRDAIRWVASFRRLSLLHSSPVTARLQQPEIPGSISILAASLFNRPPPAF